MFFLIASLLSLAVIVAPVLSIVGFLRSRAMRRQVERLTTEVETLQARLRALSQKVAQFEPPPDGVSRDRILALDAEGLRRWREELAWKW